MPAAIINPSGNGDSGQCRRDYQLIPVRLREQALTMGMDMSDSDCLTAVRMCFYSSQVPKGIFSLVVCNLSRQWQTR